MAAERFLASDKLWPALKSLAKKARKTAGVPVPTTPEAWLRELAAAYADAAETIPLGPALSIEVKEGEFFHLAPAICVKYRGLVPWSRALRDATEAALTTFVVMIGDDPKALSKPHVAFAFCYFAAHYGVDLLTEGDVGELLGFAVKNEEKLVRMIGGGKG